MREEIITGVERARPPPPLFARRHCKLCDHKNLHGQLVSLFRWLRRPRGYIRKRRNRTLQDEDTLSEIPHKYKEISPTACSKEWRHSLAVEPNRKK